MSRESASTVPFSDLVPCTTGGSVRLSIYLTRPDVEALDKVRDLLGGVLKPGPSEVIRHITREYLEQRKEIKILRKRLALAEGED